MRHVLRLFVASTLLPSAVGAQQVRTTEPVDAIRENPVRVHALTGARVVVAPGREIEEATVVIRDGMIEAVGRDVEAPAGARVWELGDHTIYAGFIDAHADLGMDDPPEDGDIGPTHWNPQVRAHFSTSSRLQDDPDRRSALRSLGFGAALAVPRLGIFRGQAAVIDLGDGNARERIVRPNLVQSISFSRNRQLGGRYPDSPMGAIALIRQTLLDADWYRRAWEAYEASGRAFLPPETSEALGSLEQAAQGLQPMLFEATREEEHLRARAIADEFGIEPWIRGSGHEYRILDVLQESPVPLIVPIDFPDAPDVRSPADALDASLAELRHWYLAPENPGRLAAAGLDFAITADGLASENDFLPNLRAAVARGLDAGDALKALTTAPARLLGLDRTHGTVEAGKVANLVVVEGDLFDPDAEIRDVWIEGDRYGVSIPPRVDPRGTWVIADASGREARLELRGTPNRLTGSIEIEGADIELESARARTESGRLEVSFPTEALGFEGVAQLSSSIDEDTFFGWDMFPDGATSTWQGRRVDSYDGDDGPGPAREVPDLDLPDIRPAMAFGRTSPPDQPEWLVVRNATVWTQGPQGRIEDADLLVQRGQVVEVGADLDVPSGAVEVDAAGKHVTPGLIDPHIHSGTHGTNERGAAVVPEVRMGDVVTHNNIWVYRQLAGGLTTAHIKHGSANPIGGQNVFVKMRWGALPDGMKIQDPPRTVKFALGENPKRAGGVRYPDTRMGTYQIIRDHFHAARDYERRWEEWERTGEGLPPRRDLRMEALLEILDQELLISSHGYRQDEFLALIRLAEEFGFRVQTLQHAVEAYKIAPELAASGVAAAVWSDWGSFKIEAYDATTYNARILLEAGVVTSLHSDNRPISSRMNWEAGKLLRTGVEEQDALSTVTLNAARVLNIQDRVGSLEPGKDADFVVWSGHPLSQFTKAEQTWIDGRRYFSLDEDQILRDRVRSERARLIQLILDRGADES